VDERRAVRVLRGPAALSYTCRMGRMGVLAFVALVISVCAVRLPGEHAAMAGMAAPEVLFNAAANAQSLSAIAEPESPPECCQIQQVLLSGSSSIAALLMLALLVIPTARVLPPITRSVPAQSHFQPPGLHGRPALFASLT
jgi:hypothetical protein